jgi:hypothetical protein
MKTTIVPACPCPSCGQLLNMATDRDDVTAPTPGSLSVCVNCVTISFFDENLRLRKPKAGELEELSENNKTTIDHARAAVLRMHKDREINRRLKMVNNDEDAERYAPLVASGQAAIVGPLVSAGPPPRKMRPAVKRRCGECGVPIWLSSRAPRGRCACPECTVKHLERVTAGD